MTALRSVRQLNLKLAGQWARVGSRFMPFADAATRELPLGRLLRLSLFQVSVGMAMALLYGTLNRVMIVELHVPAWLVSLMVALPLVFAPLRALIGFRSDTHVSALGWRRVPYIWIGTLLQFGWLAIMPFALLVLSGDTHGPVLYGQIGAGLAFLLVGAGLHTTQTAGLALATDLAPVHARPRVVALLHVMLPLGMVGSALVFGALLAEFRQVKLIQVIQGAAALTMALNIVALWKQEARNPGATTSAAQAGRAGFGVAWRAFVQGGRASRLLVAVALGSAAFGMQDILLEPYGGQILGMAVGATSLLTAMMAAGALVAFGVAARWLARGGDPCRMAAVGALVGIVAFAAVIFASPLGSALLFRVGAVLIGGGGGLFAVGTLTAAMGLDSQEHNGLALGAWGAVQASATGLAMACGGALRDVFAGLAAAGSLGPALQGPAVAYGIVYHIEIVLLFATLVAIGPLVRSAIVPRAQAPVPFGLAQLPG